MEADRLAEKACSLRLHVAIDGPAGAGKSTVGRGVAAALRCRYLDTGLMYRAVTWLALRTGVPASDGRRLGAIAMQYGFDGDTEPADSLRVDGESLREELRTPEVDALVSEVSAHPQVREALVGKQRAFAEGSCAVVVGRDIGTTVLPRAQVKLWVTASQAERARRRLAERPNGRDLAAMQTLIRGRDQFDKSRPVSPLRQADDAIVLDTEGLSADQTVEAALHHVTCRVEALSQASRDESKA